MWKPAWRHKPQSCVTVIGSSIKYCIFLHLVYISDYGIFSFTRCIPVLSLTNRSGKKKQCKSKQTYYARLNWKVTALFWTFLSTENLYLLIFILWLLAMRYFLAGIETGLLSQELEQKVRISFLHKLSLQKMKGLGFILTL